MDVGRRKVFFSPTLAVVSLMADPIVPIPLAGFCSSTTNGASVTAFALTSCMRLELFAFVGDDSAWNATVQAMSCPMLSKISLRAIKSVPQLTSTMAARMHPFPLESPIPFPRSATAISPSPACQPVSLSDLWHRLQLGHHPSTSKLPLDHSTSQ